MLLIFVQNIIHKKYKVHIQIHINIVKEKITIIESIKNIIQKDKIKAIIRLISKYKFMTIY